MTWELDLWYELWEKAGSQGLDTWHDIRGEARDARLPGRSLDTDGLEITEDGSPEGT